VFNLSGSEVIFLIIIALVVLGPDKLPDAMRKAGKAYADFKKMTSGFQSEMKSVLDEPMRELRETAELAKRSAMFDFNAMDKVTPQQPTQQPVAPAQPVDPQQPQVMSDAERQLVVEPEPAADPSPFDPQIKPAPANADDHLPPLDSAQKRAIAKAHEFEARTTAAVGGAAPPVAGDAPVVDAVADTAPGTDTE